MAPRKGLNKQCILLIIIAGMERFAFKGVSSNLVTYLTDVVKMSNSSSAKTVNKWCGLTYMLQIVVASVADSCWDKYPTILVSSFIYFLGLVALTSTALAWAWYPTNNLSSLFLFWSLCVISLGQGGYNPSLQAFGADQLENDDELPTTKDVENEKSNKKTLFFQRWYVGVCSGSLLGVIVMSYIQDTFGWVLGFALPTIAMLSSIGLIWCGSSFYSYKQHQHGNNENIQKTSFWKMVLAMKNIPSRFINSRITLSTHNSQAIELELQEKPLCPENIVNTKNMNGKASKSSICSIESAKVALRLTPVWTMLLMFTVIFQLPVTFFTKQGETMERAIGTNFKIPPATLQSAITFSIVLLMPFYDAIFIPIAKLITGDEKGINVMQRIGIGMLLSIVAMVIAAIVEIKRLELSQRMPNLKTVPISIFWLLPQYILLGISDIFTVVGMQEFFYSEVPVGMKTVGIALTTSVFGVGSFLSAALISVIEFFTTWSGKQSWFSDDMKAARLDKFYWLLAILSAASMVFYVFLSKFYTSRTDLDNENCKS